MNKFIFLCMLALTVSSHHIKTGDVDASFQKNIKTLQASVNASSNFVSTILNKSYRLPTQEEYHKRLHIAMQVFNTTGKSRLLRETTMIGYQSSWLKKHTKLNTAVEAVKYSPTFSLGIILLIVQVCGGKIHTHGSLNIQ